MSTIVALDEVYAERNAVALAFAAAAAALGWTVGSAVDPSEPHWPVLLIDTPLGQVSWHIKDDQFPAGVPDYPGVWDGHTTPVKYARLRELVAGAWESACAFGPEGEHHGGELVRCDVCGRQTCDYCGYGHNDDEQDWLCPDCAPEGKAGT